jgi:hypothetical protein
MERNSPESCCYLKNYKDGPLPVLIWAYPAEFNLSGCGTNQEVSTVYIGKLGFTSILCNAGYAALNNAEMLTVPAVRILSQTTILL